MKKTGLKEQSKHSKQPIKRASRVSSFIQQMSVGVYSFPTASTADGIKKNTAERKKMLENKKEKYQATPQELLELFWMNNP